jgi:hypothetical protein
MRANGFNVSNAIAVAWGTERRWIRVQRFDELDERRPDAVNLSGANMS